MLASALAGFQLGRVEMRLDSMAEARDALARAFQLDLELDRARKLLNRLSASG